MKKALIILGVLVVLLLIVAVSVGGAFVTHRNTMVQQKEGIQGAWAQVDTVIQRRLDLIPNLVETVKGIAAQEKEVFSNIAAARARRCQAREAPGNESPPMSSSAALFPGCWLWWKTIRS